MYGLLIYKEHCLCRCVGDDDSAASLGPSRRQVGSLLAADRPQVGGQCRSSSVLRAARSPRWVLDTRRRHRRGTEGPTSAARLVVHQVPAPAQAHRSRRQLRQLRGSNSAEERDAQGRGTIQTQCLCCVSVILRRRTYRVGQKSDTARTMYVIHCREVSLFWPTRVLRGKVK